MHKAIVAILLIAFACSKNPGTNPLTSEEKETIASEVRQTLTSYYVAIRISGLNAEFEYLDNSEDFFWVPPGFSSPLSYDSVASIIRKSAPLYSSVDNSFTDLRIVPLSRRLATYTGKLKSVMTDTTGKVTEFSLVETGVLIKKENQWKLLHGQTTLIQ